jgi:periplasmic protein TonB
MFETSRVQAPPRSRLRSFGFLPLSVAAHALAFSGVVVSNIWAVTFPGQAPPQYLTFSVADAPPPPPPPPPPPAARPAVRVVQPVRMPDNVAPTIIPEAIPEVTQNLPPVADSAGVEGGVDGGVEGGELGGVIGGVTGGVVTDTQPPPPKPPDDGRIYVERDAKLENVVVFQEPPSYPFFAQMKRLQDSLVIRYVIGKDGRIREASVVRAPQHEIFVNHTLSAIRKWRFKPFVKDGEVHEVVHELTVNYRLANAVSQH